MALVSGNDMQQTYNESQMTYMSNPMTQSHETIQQQNQDLGQIPLVTSHASELRLDIIHLMPKPAQPHSFGSPQIKINQAH